MFFIGNFVGGSIAIKESVDLAKYNIKRGLGAQVTIHGNEDLMIQYNDKKFEYIEIEQIFKEIVKDDRVSYYDYGYSSYFDSDNIVWSTNAEDNIDGLMIYGITKNQFNDLNCDNISIVEGRNFTNKEIESGDSVIILNENYMMYDNNKNKYERVKVGDRIHLNHTVYQNFPYSFTGDNNKLVYNEASEYEVIGIYKINKEIKNNVFWAQLQLDNTITYSKKMEEGAYVPLQSLKNEWEKVSELKEKYSKTDSINDKYLIYPNDMGIDYFTIQLNNPDDLIDFEKMATKKYNEKQLFDIEVFTSDNSYNAVAGPIESLSSISSIILYLSVIVSIVIIGLTITLVIRDRRHEMGLYLSLGEKKWKIILQMFLELYLIGMLAISLSIFTGNKIGECIYDYSIKVENERQEEIVNEKLEMLGSVNPNNLGLEDVSESVEFKIDSKYALSIYSISTSVFIISILIPSIYILKMNPKDIML